MVKTNKTVIPLIFSFLSVLLFIFFFNLEPVIQAMEVYQNYRIFGIYTFYLIPGILIVLFSLSLFYTAITGKNWKPMVMVATTFFVASFSAFWTAYIDNLDHMKFRKNNEITTLHDGVWFLIYGVFIMLLYIHIEFQYSENPPLWRPTLMAFLVSYPTVLGVATLIDGVNYVGYRGTPSNLANLMLQLLGILYVGVLGTYSYYKSLLNVREKEFILPAQIQFGTLVGLVLILIINGANVVFNLRLNFQVPVVLIFFFLLLTSIYVKNRNFVTVLSTPLYEIMIIDQNGITLFVYNFEKREVITNEGTNALKGSVFGALKAIFSEIIEQQADVDTVNFSERSIISKRFTHQEIDYTAILVAKTSTMYLKMALEQFCKHVKIYFPEKKSVSQPLPEKTVELVKEIFY